jgi:hypothetical protein
MFIALIMFLKFVFEIRRKLSTGFFDNNVVEEEKEEQWRVRELKDV